MITNGKKTQIICQREPWFDSVGFWIRKTEWSPDRVTQAIALPLEYRTLTTEDEGMIKPHSFQLAGEDAQQFMDELWRVGFRPSEGTGSAGSLAATQKHLEDMRTLVFKAEEKK